jgi:hypothetical protein
MVAAPSAQAAFPGTNGKIAFAHCGNPCDIWTMNSDGAGKLDLTNTPTASEDSPAWSADGKRIAYVRDRAIWRMNADGTGQIQVVAAPPVGTCAFPPCRTLGAPAWSPDGAKLVFHDYTQTFDPETGVNEHYELHTVNADGTGEAVLAQQARNARWSPDGTKIGYEFYIDGGGDNDIHWITPDGSSTFHVTQTGFEHFGDWSPYGDWMTSPSNEFDATAYKIHPDGTGKTQVQNIRPYRWSPDGTKFLAGGGGIAQSDIYTANIDGTDVTYLTNNGNSGIRDENPDWQPITVNYPRPKGATPFKTYLVPAFKQCTAPDRTHGAPLAFPSCSSPQQTSSYLTVGTPDSNGLAPTARGSVEYTTVVGNSATPANEADVKIAVDILGVLNKAGLTPYSGELSADAGLRITDKNNTPDPGGTGAGTVQDTSFPVTVPCTSGSCSVATTANAVRPGSVLEGKRAIWELGQVQVYDGGVDGLASTTADNTLFMDQGVFVP